MAAKYDIRSSKDKMHFWRNMRIMAFLKKDDHDDMKSRVFKRFNCNDKDQSTHKGFLSLLPRVSGEICLRYILSKLFLSDFCHAEFQKN